MLRTTRIAKRALLASAVAAGLGLTACGVSPALEFFETLLKT